MKSFSSNLGTIKTALINSLETNQAAAIYHYQRPSRENLKRYVVWAEDGENNSQIVNNRKAQQQLTGTIDLYTNIEFDEWADRIQTQLDAAEGVTWALDSVQYEDDTGLIHFEWTFTVV